MNEVISSFPTCPIPEVPRLDRTLKQWKPAILASTPTAASDGSTEAINGLIEPPAESPAASSTHQPQTQMPTGSRWPSMLPIKPGQPCLNPKSRIRINGSLAWVHIAPTNLGLGTQPGSRGRCGRYIICARVRTLVSWARS
nr:transposase [Arthrobacter sp. ZGTC131]